MVDDVRDITETAESKASAEALDRARLARERREAEQRKRLDELRAHAAAAQAQREKRDEDRRKRQAEQRAKDDERRVQDILREMIAQSSHIIEDKSTKASSNIKKTQEWKNVAKKINELTGKNRTDGEVKLAWKRMKLASKANLSAHRQYQMRTGGGEKPKSPSQEDLAIMAIAPHDFVVEYNNYDSDAIKVVEERKRAIWEASISRREALLQRERDRTERLERQRASRSGPRPAFAFGSSTPRLLEPVDSAGFFWAARSTNPIDQMNFFESLAASTTNVMFASAPLTRRASALHLDTSDTDNKDEPDRQPQAVMWSSVARRRTDLVPTVPAPRAPETRSGETTPGSRPGSALSNAASVVRRPTSGPRKPRPASIAGTGVNTPRGGGDTGAQSVATTPSVSRDGTLMAAGDVPRRNTTPRRPRPLSVHVTTKPTPPAAPGEGKPPLHRKPKSAKDQDKGGRGKSVSASPGRTLSPTPRASKEPSVDKEVTKANAPATDKSQVNAVEVTQKLEALQIQNGEQTAQVADDKLNESVKVENETVEVKQETKIEEIATLVSNEQQEKASEVQKEEKREEVREERREEKKESSVEKSEENEMTASMSARRITTEEQAKAALAERRRRAREELERQAERERIRLQKEAEEEAERQRQEEERQRREEEEARELAQLQRRMEEEKLRKAIEAQQQLERDEAERKVREEADKQARLKEEEEKRKAAEEAEKLRKEEAEREEKERLARKQRVEAIMARTRLRKAEEDKKAAESKAQTGPAPVAPSAEAPVAPQIDTSSVPAAVAPLVAPVVEAEAAAPTEVVDNGNSVQVADLLDFSTSQPSEAVPEAPPAAATNNGNLTADPFDVSTRQHTEDKPIDSAKSVSNDNTPAAPANNGNIGSSVGHVSANFLHSERLSNESQKLADVPKLLDDDFATHNGHGAHPLTLQNAI